MQNYPFSVLRERGRLTYVQDFERKEGAKKRMKEFRSQSKQKQKCRIRKLLNLEPNQKIYEDDLIDLKRQYTEDILKLKDQIRRLSTTLSHIEEVEEIQDGSVFKTAPSNNLIQKYIKTPEPDFHLMELQQEYEETSAELQNLRDAINPDSINELENEKFDNSKEIMRILGDCRYFQSLIDEFDSKLQHFKPNPQLQELRDKKKEIKQKIKEEIKETERLQELSYSGKFLEDETEPRIDFEETVFPIRKEKHSIKKFLEAKKKEYEELRKKNRKEIDDINNNVRSPEFYTTLRTLDDLSEARKRSNERFQELQLDQFQRLNSIRPPDIISTSSSKEDSSVPSIKKPNVQNQTVQPKKKKAIKQLGPPSFLSRQTNQFVVQTPPSNETNDKKPVKKVKQTSSHLYEPKAYTATQPVPKQKPMKYYKKPPKSSQHNEKWKEELHAIREEKELKQNHEDSPQKLNSTNDKNESNKEDLKMELKIEMNVTTEKNDKDQNDESDLELTKEKEDDHMTEKKKPEKSAVVNSEINESTIDKTEEQMLNLLLNSALTVLSNLTDSKEEKEAGHGQIEEKHDSNSTKSNDNNEEKLDSNSTKSNDNNEEKHDSNSTKSNDNNEEKDDSNSTKSNDNNEEKLDISNSKVEDKSVNQNDEKMISEKSVGEKFDESDKSSNKSTVNINQEEESHPETKEDANALTNLLASGINSLMNVNTSIDSKSKDAPIEKQDSDKHENPQDDESNVSMNDDFESDNSDANKSNDKDVNSSKENELDSSKALNKESNIDHSSDSSRKSDQKEELLNKSESNSSKGSQQEQSDHKNDVDSNSSKGSAQEQSDHKADVESSSSKESAKEQPDHKNDSESNSSKESAQAQSDHKNDSESNSSKESAKEQPDHKTDADSNSSKESAQAQSDHKTDSESNSSKESAQKSQNEINDAKNDSSKESDDSNQLGDSDSFEFFSANSNDEENKDNSDTSKSGDEPKNEKLNVSNHSSSNDMKDSSSKSPQPTYDSLKQSAVDKSRNKSSTSELRFESDSQIISNEMKRSEHQSGAEPQKLQGLFTNIMGSLMNQSNETKEKESTNNSVKQDAQSDDDIVSASLSEDQFQKSSSD